MTAHSLKEHAAFTTYWTSSSIDDLVKRERLWNPIGAAGSRSDRFGIDTLLAPNRGTGGDVSRTSISD